MKKLSIQNGYTAISMIILLAVGGILTAGAGRYAIRTSTENSGAALGTVLGQLNKAVGTYSVYNYAALVNGTMTLTPSITDLQNAGVLNANFQTTTPIGGGYGIEITREPAGCVAPNCNLTSRVWYTQPLLNSDTGRLDLAKLGAAAGAIGGDAGWSDSIGPTTVHGTGGWSRANPAGNQAGILMAINGYGSSVFSQYVDRTGTQGMVADFQMGNNNIMGAATVNANSVVLPAGDSLNIGNAHFYGDDVNSAIRTPGSFSVQHYDASPADLTANGVQAGSLQSNGDLTVARNSSVAGNQTVGSQTVYGQQVVGGSQVVYGNISASSSVTPGQVASDSGYCGGNAGAIGRDGNNNLYICN